MTTPILDDNPRNFSGQSQNWAIEDFLSPALIIETANNLLRKDKYKNHWKKNR